MVNVDEMCKCKCGCIKSRLAKSVRNVETRQGKDGREVYYGGGFVKPSGEYVPNDRLRDLAENINEVKGGSLGDVVGVVSKMKQYYDIAHDAFKGIQKYEGENHVPLWVDGRPRLPNYLGSGTNLFQRLADEEKGISFADTISKLHDINYTLAREAPSKQEQQRRIREADQLMVQQVLRAGERSLDNRLNLGLAKMGISTKMKLEDANIPYLSNRMRNIAEELKTFTPEQRQLLQDAHRNTLADIDDQLQ